MEIEDAATDAKPPLSTDLDTPLRSSSAEDALARARERRKQRSGSSTTSDVRSLVDQAKARRQQRSSSDAPLESDAQSSEAKINQLLESARRKRMSQNSFSVETIRSARVCLPRYFVVVSLLAHCDSATMRRMCPRYRLPARPASLISCSKRLEPHVGRQALQRNKGR